MNDLVARSAEGVPGVCVTPRLPMGLSLQMPILHRSESAAKKSAHRTGQLQDR